MKYQFTFGSVGGTTRVKIENGEDIKHLPELDQKMWTVLSCPTTGLELSEESLNLMNCNGDPSLHITEVIATSKWLCQVLKNPQSLFKCQAAVDIQNIADETIAATARKLNDKHVTLEMVDAAIGALTTEPQPVPAAPYDDAVMAAYKAHHDEIASYYEMERLQTLGLVAIPEETAKPGIAKEDFEKMGAAIAQWEADKAAIETANNAAMDALKAEYIPLRKLLILSRDFVILLRNFVTLEDFYDREDGRLAMFQAGTLIIDQRACHLCMRVADMAKHDAQAEQSGMFLIYCACKNQAGATMQIVAALTVGEIKNITIGKNAVFYDRQGNDWEAVVTKVIDNPISIGQAFWSPYRKVAQWVTNLIQKSAAEKNDKAFADITTGIDAKVAAAQVKEKEPEKKSAFDIAKFAGIFAAIGMAIGYIGAFFTSLFKGIHELPAWQLPVWILGLMLVISGPALIMAAIKLRHRNLAPLLNANGWAVNADALVSVLFGATLTEQVQFPLLQIKKHLSKGGVLAIVISALIVLIAIALLVVIFFAPEYGQRAIELFRK